MKRFDQQHVERLAHDFIKSRFADAWNLFQSEIQDAIIDAHVIRDIRMAHVHDSTVTFTATDLIEFRDAVKARMAVGFQLRNRVAKFKVVGEDTW